MTKRKDTDYLMISAAIRERENRMLRHEQCERILEAKNFAEAVHILSECGCGEVERADAEGIEKLIRARRSEVYAFLHSVLGGSELLDAFSLRYDYHNAKVLLKSGGENERLLLSGGRFEIAQLCEAFARDDFRALPYAFAGAVERAKQVLTESGDARRSDAILDAALFAEKQQLAQRSHSAFLKSYTALETDIYNLRTAVRVRRSGGDESTLSGLLLRGGHLDIRALAAAQGSGFAELCRGGKLEKAGEEAARALEGASLTAFERACDDALTESLCAARRMAFGEEVVIAYLAASETELTDIRILLNGKLAGLSADEIRPRLRAL